MKGRASRVALALCVFIALGCDRQSRGKTQGTPASAATQPNTAELKRYCNLGPSLAPTVKRWESFKISDNDWGVCILFDTADTSLFTPDRQDSPATNAIFQPYLPQWFRTELMSAVPGQREFATPRLLKSPFSVSAATPTTKGQTCVILATQ